AYKLVTFFKTQQGWSLLARLTTTYRLSYGDLQLMQSELRLWAQDLGLDSQSEDILSRFLLYLCKLKAKEEKSQPVDALSLNTLNALALTYQSEGLCKESEKPGVTLLEMSKELFGAEHPNTLACMGNLARTYRSLGRWKEAE